MTTLLTNAVDALAMGVEDFSANSQRRTLSAVRNFYAGALLLAKEVLVRAAPNADPDEIIGAKYKPMPDGSGGVMHVQDGPQTIDFNTIGNRFRDFGINANPKKLEALNRIRNDIEHRYSTQTEANIREAIATAFPLVADLFRHIGESPVALLGDAWQTMLETTQLYDEELKRCQATLAAVKWRSSHIETGHFACQECGSALIEQNDPSETDQDAVVLACRACGEEQETGRVIEYALDQALGGEAYLRAKDEGMEGPLFSCPECNLNTFIDHDDACAVCGAEPEGDAECARCSNDIELEQRLYGDSSSLCSYCAHVMDKVMND